MSASHRRAAENFVSQRVGKRVEDRHAAGADGRLADAARADGRFRIGNVQRLPFHLVPVHPEWSAAWCGGNAWPAAGRSAGRKPTSGRWRGRCRASSGPAPDRPGARMNHRADVGHGEIIQDPVFAGFQIDFHLGKSRDIGMGLAIARHGVARHGQQSLTRQRLRRSHRKFIDALRQLVAVVDAAQFDGALGSLRQRHAGAAAFADRRARRPLRNLRACRRDPWPRSAAACPWHPVPPHKPRASSRAWSGCRPKDSSTADCCPVLPQVISHFSQGMPRISAVTRWQSLTDSVPRLPMPDWMYSLPSGLMTNSPSKPTEPPTKQLVATPMPRSLRAAALGLRLSLLPVGTPHAPLSSASLINALVT